MINAKSVDVIGECCNNEGIRTLQFISQVSHDASFHFERPTANTFGDQPQIVDHLDSKYVNIGLSNIDTAEKRQSGQKNGAFANVAIYEDTIIAHKNGYILNKNQISGLKTQQRKLAKKIEELLDELE